MNSSSSQNNHNAERACIVVPCYNESENLPKIIEKISSMKSEGELSDFDFVFVNDGSKDMSLKIINNASYNCEWVKVQNHEVNRGFAAGLNTGRKYALENSYGYLGQIDCDLTHPLELLKEMRDSLSEYDMVIASRYVGTGGMKNVPLWRVILSKTSQFGFRIFFRTKTRDSTSGFRLCRRKIFEDIVLQDNTFAIQLELTIKAEKTGFKIYEIPFVLENRQFGSSKFNLKQFIEYGKSVFKLLFVYK